MSQCIQNLPPEMLLKIFSYINKEALITTIPDVCQHWNDLHSDPSLYRHLHFSDTKPETWIAVALLGMAPWLKTFRMTNRSDADELLSHLSQNHPQLERLEIRKCRGQPSNKYVSPASLRCVIDNCNQLQHLTLERTHCESSVFYEEIGLKLPLLKVIHFGGAWQNFSSAALLNIVANCRGVEEFRVDCDYAYVDTVSSTTVTVFCDAFSQSLRTAEFNDCTTWNDESLASVSRCHHLRELHLRDARHVTDDGIMSLVGMPALVDLGVETANLVTPQGWVRLLENPALSRLEKLTLAGGYIDDDVLTTIKCLKNLTELTVYRTRLCTDISMRGISTMASLTRLYLPILKLVTDEGIMALADLPNIKSLNLCSPDQITTQCWIEFFRMPFVRKITHLWFHFCDSLNDEVAKVVADNLRDLRELKLAYCDKISRVGRSYVRRKTPTDCRVTF